MVRVQCSVDVLLDFARTVTSIARQGVVVKDEVGEDGGDGTNMDK